MATGSKKPKWGVVNLKQIEARRKELGLSKTAMANNLGITNSTYHNWARGTTIPHPAQQDQIKAALDSMTGASNGTGTTRRKPGPKPGSKRQPKAVPERTAATRENVAGGSIPMPSGFTPTGHPFYPSTNGPSVPGDTTSIATITAAFITSQSAKGPVEQQMVFDFISGLQKALYPTATPAAVTKVEEPVGASA